MSRSPPTLVLVPGSWHKPDCFRKISCIFEEQHGFKCVSIALPSTSGDPAATFGDDVDHVRTAITNEVENGQDVVVIVHSYGGMVGNSAIKGFTPPRGSKKQVVHDPAVGHVIGLVLIASGFTITGLAFMDPFFGHPPPYWRANKDTGLAEFVSSPRELFYHDLPSDEGDYWVSQLTPQSLKSLFEGGERAYAGWQDVPVWYIGTVEDRGLPVVAQRLIVGMARAMGGRVEHRELRTSHSPFLSQPGETAGIVLQAVEAFTGQTSDRVSPAKARLHGVSVPVVTLRQPVTWYRFGLPLAFGHLIGRAVLAFGWVKRLWDAGSNKVGRRKRA